MCNNKNILAQTAQLPPSFDWVVSFMVTVIVAMVSHWHVYRAVDSWYANFQKINTFDMQPEKEFSKG
jgi:hypothetical protein